MEWEYGPNYILVPFESPLICTANYKVQISIENCQLTNHQRYAGLAYTRVTMWHQSTVQH